MKISTMTSLIEGMIMKKSTGYWLVQTTQGPFDCTLAAQLCAAARTGKASRSNGPVNEDQYAALGDRVQVRQTGTAQGVIETILPRRNQFWRRAAQAKPGQHAAGQVIAANLDQVIPVFAATDPAPHWNMLDRYLVSAEAAGIPAQIVISKLDLMEQLPVDEQAELEAALADYRRIGYAVYKVSAYQQRGLEELHALLQGRTSALLGKSGVGKTSLLNAVQPGLGQRVSAVSAYTGKGRHTTTHLELFPLSGGGALLDTPGVREFGLWGVEDEDLAWYFPEMRPYLGQCRFGADCRHADEPGCAVRKAVMTGAISPRRYKSFMHLQDES
jgi:ribosome biogenesis GTPase